MLTLPDSIWFGPHCSYGLQANSSCIRCVILIRGVLLGVWGFTEITSPTFSFLYIKESLKCVLQRWIWEATKALLDWDLPDQLNFLISHSDVLDFESIKYMDFGRVTKTNTNKVEDFILSVENNAKDFLPLLFSQKIYFRKLVILTTLSYLSNVYKFFKN